VVRGKKQRKNESAEYKKQLNPGRTQTGQFGRANPTALSPALVKGRFGQQIPVQMKEDDHRNSYEAQAIHLRNESAGTGFAGETTQDSGGVFCKKCPLSSAIRRRVWAHNGRAGYIGLHFTRRRHNRPRCCLISKVAEWPGRFF
jgi:hypothetical protein